MKLLNLLWLIAAMALASCAERSKPLPPTLMEYLPAEYTGVHFVNEVHETAKRNVGSYDYMYNGAGVAIVDLNGDRLPDLVLCGNDVPVRIYQNLGELRFKDVTETSGVNHGGWTTGVTAADLNGDGLPELYFSRSGPDFRQESTKNLCYVNRGDFRFEEQAENRGIANDGLSTQAVFFDADADGDLDLFVLNHALRNIANLAPEWLAAANQLPPALQRRFSNALYRNNGDGSFTEVTRPSGIAGMGFGLGVAISDFDGDGLPDIFVANDYFVPDRLYLNQGEGRFAEASAKKFRHTSFFSMGCDAADMNNDGLVDLVVPDMSPNDHYRSKVLMAGMDTAQFRYLERLGYTPQYMFNALYLNQGEGLMSDIAHFAGVAKTDWSWAPLLADLDNDGLKDLFISNGIYRDITDNDWRRRLFAEMVDGKVAPERYLELLNEATMTPGVNALFKNRGDLKFDPAETAWGLDSTSFSQGAAYGDLDGDGDLDLVVNNLGSKAFVIRNTSADRGAKSIRIHLEGAEGLTALGSRVVIHLAGGMQMAEYQFTRGYQSYMEPVLHFGLGKEAPATIDSLEVFWPNQKRSVYRQLSTGQTHYLTYDPEDSSPLEAPKKNPMDLRYWDITKLAFERPIEHHENNFDDFRVEQLLPHRMSTLGPPLAVADINGDHLDDFFLGGAFGQSPRLFVQNAQGYFREQALPKDLAAGEDLGAHFFDADGDGDLDLYLARGGGGEFYEHAKDLQDVFLRNDGQGRFTIDSGALPSMPVSTKAIVAFDADGDGDLDLFVGGRNTPGQYPRGARSFLLENREGSFYDQTQAWAPELLEEQMITDATWVNAMGALLVVGEWMQPRVFAWTPHRPGLVEKDLRGAERLQGWWQSAQVLEQNGEERILLGNIGENNKYHPSNEKPLYLFADDFDGNGSVDIVLSKDYKGRKVPVRGRMCSSSQMPVIKERFETYDAFARASLEEVLGLDSLDARWVYSANEFASGYLLFVDADSVRFEPFPERLQLAPVMRAVTAGDDLLFVGNMYTTEVETTPYDAGVGAVWPSEASVLTPAESGFFAPGDVRSMQAISISSDKVPGVVIASNNGRVKVFMRNLP